MLELAIHCFLLINQLHPLFLNPAEGFDHFIPLLVVLSIIVFFGLNVDG